jgi:hypothetical protein
LYSTVRAGNREASVENIPHLERGARAAKESNDRQPPVVGECLDFTRYVVAADHVQDHVDALATGELHHHLHEILRAVIDAALGA